MWREEGGAGGLGVGVVMMIWGGAGSGFGVSSSVMGCADVGVSVA